MTGNPYPVGSGEHLLYEIFAERPDDQDDVAEAIWLAHGEVGDPEPRPWTLSYPASHTKARYRKMAQAAISALRQQPHQD